jgi:type IV pilus biogenesis/stability protein PilW
MSVRRLLAVLLVVALAGCASMSGKASRKDEATAHYKMGLRYMQEDSVQAAFVEFHRALELNPRDKEVHNALGIVYLRLEDPGMAAEHFRTASRIDPEYSEAHNNLCFVSYQMGRYQDAVSSCERALANKQYETPEVAFYNLGRSYYSMSRYEEAAQAFKDGLRRRPGQAAVYYALALAYNKQNLYGQAAEAMELALRLDSRFGGNREKAEAEFQDQLITAPADPRVADDLRNYLEILKY